MTEKKLPAKGKRETLMELEARLGEYEGPDRVLRLKEVLRLAEELGKLYKNRIKIESGFESLDNLIDGFRGGEVTTISGFTGQGKSLTAHSMTEFQEASGVASLWFPFENGLLLFSEKMQRVDGTLPDLLYLPAELKAGDLRWLCERVLEARLKYDIAAVYIDHLHYVVPPNVRDNQLSVAIGRVMRTLKTMAENLNICVFLMTHLKLLKMEHEPDLGDIRDSSFIEQESDNIFFVWRDDSTENEGILKVGKNRRVGVRNKRIRMAKTGNFFREKFVETPWDNETEKVGQGQERRKGGRH